MRRALLRYRGTHLRNIRREVSHVSAQYQCSSGTDATSSSQQRRPINRVLVVAKVSRYEREQQQSGLSGEPLHRHLNKLGLCVSTLLESREVHERAVSMLLNSFSSCGIKTRVVKSTDFVCEHDDDAVIAAGGDGTFLLSARYISKNGPPIVGVNTDPVRSKGFLCSIDTNNEEKLQRYISKLHIGDYEEYYRCRMQVSLVSDSGKIDNSLPYVLNEVFFAERDASKPSLLGLKIDSEKDYAAQKSSGIIVSTGSGSTAWILSVARVTKEQVEAIFDVIGREKNSDQELLRIAEEANTRKVIYGSEERLMQYIIREPVINSVNSLPHTFGRAKNISLRSLGMNSTLTADGIGNLEISAGTFVNLSLPLEADLKCIRFR